MTTEPTQVVKVFISYAHEDEGQLQELVKHLQLLKREGLIDVWYDRNINPGAEWGTKIETSLSEAQIILLLISADFMDSDYCFAFELKEAMKKNEHGEAIVIPIILRPVDWQWAPFGKLQALPTNAKPIKDASWHSSDEAFLNVATGIRNAVEECRANAKQAREATEHRTNAKQAREATEHSVKTNRVIIALEDPNYQWRTIEGVSKETQLPPEEVQEIISELGGQVIKSSIPDNKARPLYTTKAFYRSKRTNQPDLSEEFAVRDRNPAAQTQQQSAYTEVLQIVQDVLSQQLEALTSLIMDQVQKELQKRRATP